MSLDKARLAADLKSILYDAAKQAFKETYKTNSDNLNSLLTSDEYLTEKQLQNIRDVQSENVAKAFAKKLSEEASTDLAEVFDSFVKSATVVYKLTAPNGAVSGMIKIE